VVRVNILILNCNENFKLVSIAKWSKACTVYNHLNIEITVSNPARGMDVCLHVSVLCSMCR
jgi:hypothetical protein